MKSRQKFTVSEKNIARRSDSEAVNCLDIRLKKKISSNPLLQKNLNFLQTYNNLFRKPSYQFGDADTYFRQTLRNYEAFDLIRDLNLQSHFIKSVKSFESLNKQRKPRTKRTLLSPKVPKTHSFTDLPLEPDLEKEFVIKELYSLSKKRDIASEEESEDNEYFSPSNEPLVDLEEVEEPLGEETTSSRDELKDNLEDYLIPHSAIMGDPILESEEYGGFVTEDEEDFNKLPEDEGEDDEMKEVEKMIEQASEELQQVVEENQQLMDALEQKDDSTVPAAEIPATKAVGEGGDGSTFKFDASIDAAVLKELEDAEKQAKETADIILELKNRVADLLKKEKMTEEEAKELEQKNKELKNQMIKFEEKTKRIQFLIGQSNLFENMIPVKPALQSKHNEDMLPKVIVCGLTENNMPKLIVCDGKQKCRTKPEKKEMEATSPTDTTRKFAKKLNECYCMQEKLAAENADLEDKSRYKLQSDLLSKDQTVECLQRQLVNLQTEMRMVCHENSLLNEKLQGSTVPPCGHSCSPPTSPGKNNKMPCGKGKGICPADIESRLKEYSNNTENLERQLGDMEVEVRNMQQELTAVQKEREHLEHHRKMLCVPPPCIMPPCMPHPCVPPPPCGPQKSNSDQQLRELREQYNRLQDDYKGKLTEVAGLRAENEKLKTNNQEAEEAKKIAEDKLKEADNELKILKGKMKGPKGSGTKEQLIEQEQQLIVAKQRFREAQDELEELRALVQDQQDQISDYRNKYLEAQQSVEEQRRQIDLMEMENQRIAEQVNLEIQRVKNQFQEKLQELMPLPDILKSTQIKLQEAQQMHLLAERNNESIGRELQLYKDKIAAMNNEMNQAKSDQQLGADEKASLSVQIEQLEQRVIELQEENSVLSDTAERLREQCDELESLAEQRLHEITQLESQLESVREETARQVARIKDRCEIVRKSMQNQISDLERQLAQSRAMAKTAQKDRDDIRQKMQAQINNLNENFEDAQMRIKNLQGHVNFLRNSYGNVFPTNEECPTKKVPDPCDCGSDY